MLHIRPALTSFVLHYNIFNLASSLEETDTFEEIVTSGYMTGGRGK